MRRISIFNIAVIVAGLSSVASANAFIVGLYDAKALGRGNASAATDTDPSSITFNIGGLAGDQGTNVMIGGALAFPGASYTDTSGIKTDADLGTPIIPHLFVSSRISDLIAVGIGFHSPFAGDIDWPDSAPGNDVAKLQSIRTYFITPSVGVNLGKVIPGLTLGAGVDLVPATLEIRQFIFFGETQGEAHLGFNAFGVGGRVGAMFRPEALPQLSLGATWRSEVTEDFTGKGDFDIAEPYRGQLPPDGDISTTFKIPQSVSAGVAARPVAGFEIEADVTWVNWAAFDEVVIKLPGDNPANNMSVVPQNYTDTYTFSIGAEYKLPESRASLRAGYTFDPTPVPDTTLNASLPDADRHMISAGASYNVGDYDLHLGLQWLMPASRNTSDAPYMPVHKGSYEIQAYIAALTIAGHLGR
jgi:long-chain fatty acid transport protein